MLQLNMGLKQHHFVLVHGAGHGAWCWVKVVALLESAGHRVTALDLVSAGEDTRSADDVSSLEQYDRPLEDLLASWPEGEKVILVGHSLGGSSLTRMSELFPKKISVAVYLAALMPAPGQDLNEAQAADPEFLSLDYDVIFHTKVEGGPPTSMEFPFQTLRDFYYNKCSPEDLAFAADRGKRFPFLPTLFGPIAVTEENYGSVPKVFVISSQDRAVTPYSCRKMIALNPPNEVHEIDTDHSSFFSGVELLEKVLVDIAAKYGRSSDGRVAPKARKVGPTRPGRDFPSDATAQLQYSV